MNKFDVAVIGGGAAGLACAVSLLRGNKNLKICIAEACDRLGKKLAATGNGQGNISNTEMNVSHYHGGNLKLAEDIACKDSYAGAKLFDCLFSADEKGRIYPAGKQASALCDSLINALNFYGGAEIMTGSAVSEIAETKEGFSVCAGKKVLFADFVVFCVGGKAQKQFGTDGSAYAIVEKFGHKTTPLFPSIVQLRTDISHIKSLKGIRVDCVVTALVEGRAAVKVRGDVIFTDYGVSGNAVFSVSSYIAGKTGAELSIEFLPDFAAEEIERCISAKQKYGWKRDEVLSGLLHNQLGRAVIRRANSDKPSEIAGMLKDFRLKVTGTLGFDYAQVTKGGIEMSGITDELESRFVKNLFFAGEVLDIDGDCGGYNLQWAFTGGKRVADAILKRV